MLVGIVLGGVTLVGIVLGGECLMSQDWTSPSEPPAQQICLLAFCNYRMSHAGKVATEGSHLVGGNLHTILPSLKGNNPPLTWDLKLDSDPVGHVEKP